MTADRLEPHNQGGKMTLKEFYLEGKTAIVPGAGRGIGKAIALALAAAPSASTKIADFWVNRSLSLYLL